VQVDVREAGIDVQIDGTRMHFAAPKERSGFFGFVTRGTGVAAMRNIKLSP
jgi:hypothetical protein